MDSQDSQRQLLRRPVRVCFVIDNLSRAGTEMQLLLLLKHLDRTQIEPYLCLLDGQADSSRELEPSDLPVLRLGVCRLLSPHGARQAVRFLSFVRKQRIDVVQTYFPDSTRFAAPLAKAAGVRAVIGSRRNVGHWMSGFDARVARFYNRFFIDRIIANCDAARQAAIEQENARAADVIVISNAIDLDRFHSIGHWTAKPSGQSRRVGMVGNLREVKGPDVFIRAAQTVIQAWPDTHFEIAGGGNSAPYEELIDLLGLRKSVRLLGPVVDVPAFLATLDVAVLPSRAEGLSNALLEYLAAGRPIVATRVGANSELIEDEENGRLVESGNVKELAHAIISFLSDESAALGMARNARHTADLFSVSEMLGQMVHEYLACRG